MNGKLGENIYIYEFFFIIYLIQSNRDFDFVAFRFETREKKQTSM